MILQAARFCDTCLYSETKTIENHNRLWSLLAFLLTYTACISAVLSLNSENNSRTTNQRTMTPRTKIGLPHKAAATWEIAAANVYKQWFYAPSSPPPPKQVERTYDDFENCIDLYGTVRNNFATREALFQPLACISYPNRRYRRYNNNIVHKWLIHRQPYWLKSIQYNTLHWKSSLAFQALEMDENQGAKKKAFGLDLYLEGQFC